MCFVGCVRAMMPFLLYCVYCVRDILFFYRGFIGDNNGDIMPVVVNSMTIIIIIIIM